MIYDTWGEAGNCRACGGITNYALDGYVYLCGDCARNLAESIEHLLGSENRSNKVRGEGKGGGG